MTYLNLIKKKQTDFINLQKDSFYSRSNCQLCTSDKAISKTIMIYQHLFSILSIQSNLFFWGLFS